jgi:hypothetical protein
MSAVSRSSLAAGILASNEMSATKDVRKRKERLSVNSFRNESLGLRKTGDSQGSYIHDDMAGGCSGSGPKGLGLIGKDPERRPFGPMSGASGTRCDSQYFPGK